MDGRKSVQHAEQPRISGYDWPADVGVPAVRVPAAEGRIGDGNQRARESDPAGRDVPFADFNFISTGEFGLTATVISGPVPYFPRISEPGALSTMCDGGYIARPKERAGPNVIDIRVL